MVYTYFTFPQDYCLTYSILRPPEGKLLPNNGTLNPNPRSSPLLHPRKCHTLSIVATKLTAIASIPNFLQVSRMNGLTLTSQERESEDMDLDICLFVSTLTEEDNGRHISPFRLQAPFSGELQYNSSYIVNTYCTPKRIRFQGRLGIQCLSVSLSLASIRIGTGGRPST